ncbi:MAG: glycogen/starch synthase, partial [Lacipirellulaceae bacterium]
AYQGNFWHWDMALTGIDWKHFNHHEMEYYGQLSFLKTGIAFADAVTTVSPTYAREILEPPLSCGCEGILQHRRDDLSGIINGVDYSAWSPVADEFLGENTFNADTWREVKPKCKAELQRRMELPQQPEVPLLAAVGRLADQKGFDLIARVMRDWAEQGNAGDPIAQWVILGTGAPKYHSMLADLALEFPDRIAVRLEFSNELAHVIEAGADMFLMPSQYEPCGLNQLYSLQYGTVPVVRETGGLNDTVVNAHKETIENGTATGFTFYDYSAYALSETLHRACGIYNSPDTWAQIVSTGMRQDWSWGRSAGEYRELYERTLAKKMEAVAG